MTMLSIITPFYNECESLPAYRERLTNVLNSLHIDCEILLIDDHSSDESANFARRWAEEDSRVSYFRFSRNCGSHAALSAGLCHCQGDCAVLMAADLQDPPETIPELVEQWQDGNDVVWAAREERLGESRVSLFMSRLYYRLMRRFALPEMHEHGADFLLLDRRVIDAYNLIPEKNTSLLAMILWMGFRQTTIGYVKEARFAGTSKWNLSKKLKLFADSIVSFSYVPIRLMSWLGIAVSLLGFAYASYVFINGLMGATITGWASLMVVVLVLGGLQLLMLGVLGEYIWRTYDESRGRPLYILEETARAKPYRSRSREDLKDGVQVEDFERVVK